MSGADDSETLNKSSRRGYVFEVLMKPVAISSLLDILRALTG